MRFDRLAVSLAPRTTAQCLDLAVLFAGRHLGALLTVWLLFAAPVCGGIFYATYWWRELAERSVGFVSEGDELLALLPLFLVLGPFGVVLVASAGPAVFGEPWTPGRVFAVFRSGRVWRLMLEQMLWGVLVGVGTMMCVFPAILLTARFGFRIEQTLLAEVGAAGHDKRVGELVRGGYDDLLQRKLFITLFGCALWGVLFLVLDGALFWLFGLRVLMGRLFQDGIPGPDQANELFWSLVTSDPRVLTLEAAAALLAYPVCRLAWLFCYVDLRVRSDCWDLELRMSQAARRLRPAESRDLPAGGRAKAAAIAGLCLLLGLCTSTPLSAQEAPVAPGASARQAVQDIITSPEFRRVREELNRKPIQPKEFKEPWWWKYFKWSGKLPDWVVAIGNFFAWMVSGSAQIVLIIVVAVIVLMLLRLWLGQKPVATATAAAARSTAAEVVTPGDKPADEYLERARKLAAAGEYREAVAQLLLGVMSHLERAGLIRYRRGLTHRDYLRAAARTPPVQGALRTIVRIYEPLGFGRREPLPEHFEEALAGYRSGLSSG